KKAGAVTVSHLRFGARPIQAPYLIQQAHFIGCHQPMFLERLNLAEKLLPGGALLLNSPHSPEHVWDTLPRETQQCLIDRRARLFVIDGHRVARECGMGGRVNTVMQACFFAVSGVLPQAEAVAAIKNSIRKTYQRKGEEVVRRNLAAVDRALAHLHEVVLPEAASSSRPVRPPVADGAPGFVRDVLGPMIACRGDLIPVSALPADGTYPVGTARWEKRSLAVEIPAWNQ